jgi:GR25 family glycosyltransferase involved in LPS biosynthesis
MLYKKIDKLKGIPTINCISLDESVDRRTVLINDFKKYSIDKINFLISGRYNKKYSDKAEGKLLHTLNNGTIGCSISHLKNIKQWLENTQEEYGFFCEDDLSLETIPFWNKNWQDFINDISTDWECIQLLTLSTTIKSLEPRERAWNDWGATAYILKRAYAEKIVKTYIDNESFKLELPDPYSHIQPLIENILFTLGKTYTIPLFVENINLESTFCKDLNHNKDLHQQTHITSHKTILNLWKNKKNIKIVDYFTFYEPLGKEMFELRINMLKDIVDEFVVCESNKTQSGQTIPYKLKQLITDLKFEHVNIKVIELDIPNDNELVITEEDKINCYENNFTNENSLKARARERLQKDALLKVIDEYSNDTVFIHSDIDEIIDPKHINWIANIVQQNQNTLIKIPLIHLEGRADLRVYNKDTNTPKEWTGMFMCTKQHLINATPTQLRSNANNPYPVSFVAQNNKILKDLGWHFS